MRRRSSKAFTFPSAEAITLFASVQAAAQAPRIDRHHEDRMPVHGYEPTREAAMAAFAKSWRRE
jgi:hypothetical protein